MNDENDLDSKLDDFEKGIKKANSEDNISKKEAILMTLICFFILLSMIFSINSFLSYKKDIIENSQKSTQSNGEVSEVVNNE